MPHFHLRTWKKVSYPPNWHWSYNIYLLRRINHDYIEVRFRVFRGLAAGVKTPAECKTCHLLNISQCGVSEHSEQFVLTLYNPLSRPVTEFVRLPIPGERAYSVVDPSGLRLTVQFVPLPSAVLRIPGRQSTATAELVFQADDLPPLGYKSYLVTKESRSSYLNTLRAKRSAESETGGPVDIGDRVSIKVVILLGIRHYYYFVSSNLVCKYGIIIYLYIGILLLSPITKLVYFT